MNKSKIQILWILLFFMATIFIVHVSFLYSQQTLNTKAILIRIDGIVGTIDKPTEDYVRYALSLATDRGVPLIIIVNSYGGYLESTINIADILLNAKVPVIGFIADKAFSAASIVVQPMHIVAITPYGVIGAAQPIQINPVTGQYEYVNESKVINSIVALATRYAEARGRNKTAVEMFIRRNLVLRGEEAVKYHVVDIIANDLDDLINKVNNQMVTISYGDHRYNVTIRIDGYEYIEPGLQIQLYAYLRDSLINSILWFIGFFGTFILLLTGRIDLIPFTIVFLLLALVGGGMDINVVSVLLIGLGSILIAIELVTPGYGILGISGIIALTFGFLLMPMAPATYLYPSVIESIRIIILILGGGLGALFSFIMYKILETNRKRKHIQISSIVQAQIGKVVEKIEPNKKGLVMVGGEYWSAESDEVIEPGEEVEVIGRKGFTLIVRKKRT
ncbi:protein of unknown function DUF107 [Ignisphaera aggregans DSM 17230]|uniref:Uncharacterized protein n=1 Tax=Ignisphaera aggregans (strain DSM 17230 / JCM 13409 / AQ1.S1) TaxID=583356 RepID=E0SQD5_IGNAA|nr:protein of unknown function DUF107 [Ignisphaera aggregans DSM 17230]